MTLAAAVVDLADLYRPKAIYVDEGGVGGGVVDRLRFLGQPVQGVQFGGSADRLNTSGAHVYANKRAEMWGSMREWLKGGVIPPTPELIADLEGVEYGYVMRSGVDAIQLEKKEDMKKRGLASSDFGDALALTFAVARSTTPSASLAWLPVQLGGQHGCDRLRVEWPSALVQEALCSELTGYGAQA